MLPEIIEQFEQMSFEEVCTFIDALEKIALTLPQVPMPVTHHFSKGLYGRELLVPAGTYIGGKIHKFENFNILSQGEMLLFSIEGRKRVKAPFHIVSPAGVKRVAIALEDCTWTTIHATEETNIDKIEEEVIVKSYDQLPVEDRQWLGQR